MALIATSGALVLTMLTTSASVQPSDVATQTRTIRTADLDLSNRKDVRTLNHRLRIAIVEVCGVASAIDLAGTQSVTRCRHALAARTIVDRSRAISIAQHNEGPAISGPQPRIYVPPR